MLTINPSTGNLKFGRPLLFSEELSEFFPELIRLTARPIKLPSPRGF
jgi:hypothetical protein